MTKTMKKKYELTGETEVVSGVALHRIRALKDFRCVKKGDLGGWVEKEENLSQEGNCWVYGDARVFGDARVYGNAQVYGDARVYDNAYVYGNAHVYGDAQVYGDAWVGENAQVYGDAYVSGNAQVYGDAWVSGDAHVYDNARVYGNALVSGDAQVYGDAYVSGNAQVYGDAWVSGDAHVYGDAQVYGNARVYGDAKLRGNAIVNFCFVLKTGSFGGLKDKNDLFMRCPQKGSFTAFKKVVGEDGPLILEIEVPADAKRSSAAGNKCRCSKAKAVALYNLDGTPSAETKARSQKDGYFVYELGKVAVPESFDGNRWNECSTGIHFFMSFEEARDY